MRRCRSYNHRISDDGVAVVEALALLEEDERDDDKVLDLNCMFSQDKSRGGRSRFEAGDRCFVVVFCCVELVKGYGEGESTCERV